MSGGGLLAASLKISGDQRFDDLCYLLSGWSSVEETNISADDVIKLVAYVSSMARTNDRVTNAPVMSKDDAGQARVSFYQFLSRDLPWKKKRFYDAQDARDGFNA